MSSYVNLLFAEERRYHSAASESKALKIMGWLAVLAVCLYVLNFFWTHFSILSKASSLSAAWTKQEAPYNEAIAANILVTSAARARGEMAGWNRARISGNALLEAIQLNIPPEIQLTELRLTGVLAGIEGEPVQSRSPGKLPAPERKFSLRLKGIALGNENDKLFLNLVEDLKNDTLLKSLGIAVKLEEATRIQASSTPGGRSVENASQFTIQCRFAPRPCQ